MILPCTHACTNRYAYIDQYSGILILCFLYTMSGLAWQCGGLTALNSVTNQHYIDILVYSTMYIFIEEIFRIVIVISVTKMLKISALIRYFVNEVLRWYLAKESLLNTCRYACFSSEWSRVGIGFDLGWSGRTIFMSRLNRSQEHVTKLH